MCGSTVEFFTTFVFCVVGVVLLTLGRRLFWLFVACAGFVAGYEYAGSTAGFQNQWTVYLVAFGAGCAGALLAVFLQSIAIGAAGFLLGGYSAVALMRLLELLTQQNLWFAYIVGGVVGLVSMVALFDYALIFLSSLAGASLIVQAVSFSQPVEILLFLVLAMGGAALQSIYQPRGPTGSRL